jgi:hypothetical protein
MASRTRRSPVSTDKRFRKLKTGADFGPRERWQHSGCTFEYTERAGIMAARATEEHILDTLALRRLLDQIQIEAGLRFKADYHAASIAAHVTGSYSGMARSADGVFIEYERSDAQEAAYRRWKNAVRELGARYGAAVISTVCHDTPPAPQDIPILQDGLQKLAVWYGMRRR